MHNTRDRKRSGLNDTTSTPPAKRGRPKIDTMLSRYPPINPEDDVDEVALQRNEQALSKEIERETPRKEVVLPLMKHTFSSRREYILSESSDLTLEELLQKYPALAFPFAVSHLFFNSC